jgi:O-antigen ligase
MASHQVAEGSVMLKDWTAFGHTGSGLSQAVTLTGLAVTAVFVGAAVPLYVRAIDDGFVRMAAMPMLLLLCLLLVYSRQMLLLLIILLRASVDPVFDSSKFSLSGQQIGVGALVNAFVLLIAFLLVLEKPKLLPKGPVASMWAAFLIAAFCGVAISPVKVNALRTYLGLLSYIAVFASAFYFVRSPQDFRSCVRIVLWSSAIPSLYVFAEVATGGAHRGDGFRLQSTFSHPNIFAFYLTLVISLTLYLTKTAVGKQSAGIRAGLGFYMLFLLGLLLLTQTRSAWVACFVFFAVYGLIFERRYLLYLLFIPVAALLVPSVQDRLLDLATGNDTYVQYAKLNSFAWRKLMWESGLKWMQPNHYLVGYGLDSFRYYSPVFFPLAGNFNPGAHSVYVQLLFEIGAFGFLAYAWLYARLLGWMRSMARVDKLGAFVSIFLVVEYLLFSFSDNMLGYLSFNWYFWFMAGAAVAVALSARREVTPVQRQPVSVSKTLEVRKYIA